MKNTVLGGLLIIILLVTPTTVTHADERANATVPNIVIYIEDSEREKGPNDITTILNDINENSRQINNMLCTRNDTIQQIKQAMDTNVKNKVRMNDEQIAAFKSFSDLATVKNINTAAHLNKVELYRDLKQVQREILHTDTNVSKVYAELAEIYKAQRSAMGEISSVVEHGKNLIALLVS